MPLDCFVVVTTDKVELCVPVEARTGTVEPDQVNMVGSIGGSAYYKSDVSSDDPATWSDQPITGDAAWTSLSGSRMTVSLTTGELYYVEDIAEWLDQEPSQTFPDGWTSCPTWADDPMFPGPFDTDGNTLVAWSSTPGGGPLKATGNFTETDAAWDLEIPDAAAIWAAVDMNRIVYASALPSGDIEIRLIQDVWSDAGQGARVTTTLYTVPETPLEDPSGTTQTVKSVSLSGQFLTFMTEDSNGLKTIYLPAIWYNLRLWPFIYPAGQIDGDVTPIPIPYPFTGTPDIALDVRGPILVAVKSGGGTSDVLSIVDIAGSGVVDAPLPNGGSPGVFGGSGGNGGLGGTNDVEWVPPIDGVSLDQISVSSSALTSASVEAFVQRMTTWLVEESTDLSWLPGVNRSPTDGGENRATETRASSGFLWMARTDIPLIIEVILNELRHLLPPPFFRSTWSASAALNVGKNMDRHGL